MKSSTETHTSFLSLMISLFSAMGTTFILFSYYAGTDDTLSMRELVVLGGGFILTAGCVFFFSRKLPSWTLLLEAVCAVLISAACNFEFSELMKLPFQLPANNIVTIREIDEGATLSMTWAYWFRPRTMNGDPFTENPDRDISFAQLIRSDNYFEITIDESPSLKAGETGSWIGVADKFRTRLAVLCFKAEGGAVTLSVSGRNEPLTISPEMTEEQPYRIILKNGLLPDSAGNLVQIFLWAGGFLMLLICGTVVCRAITCCCGVHKNVLILLYAFLIPCVFMLILCFFLKICPFGEKSFLINDMWGEYADYMAYFRSILSGENDIFYSFSKSLGDDLLSLLAFYVINPMNWLVCLFQPEDLPLAVTILVIMRYGICGLTAAVYFLNRRKCGYSALLFSTCYALMSFNFVNAENTNLRESAMVLPLVIMGLEKLIEGGSICCYVWSLAAAIFLNFYSGYQIILFATLYFLLSIMRQASVIEYRKQLFRFLYTSLLAAGITAVLLIPVAIQLQNGPKGFDPSIFHFKINMPWDGLFGKLLISAFDIQEISNGYPSLYVGICCLIFVILFFPNPKISHRTKVCTALHLTLSIIIMQINPLNLMLHGFNEPLWWPYRYSFIICFFLTMIAQESFAKCSGWTISGLSLTLLLTGILIFSLLRSDYSWMSRESIYLNIILIFAYLMILFWGRIPNTTYITIAIALLTLPELFLNASHIIRINTAYERSNTIGDYQTFFTENDVLIDQIKSSDNSFYRIEKTYYRTPNDPMLFNYHGISHYSSTLNQHITKFLSKNGFRLSPPYRIYYQEGSDTAMDSLLGIKYLVSGNSIAKPYIPIFTEGSHTIYENPYALPIMFTASPSIAETNIPENEEGFELQNMIFSALTGEEILIYIPAEANSPELSGIKTENNTDEICYMTENNNDVNLTWKIMSKDNGTLYAFFPAKEIHPVRLKLNGKRTGYYFDEFSYHILQLGSYKKGKTAKLEMTPLQDRVCIRDAQFYHEDLPALERAVSILREDKTELKKVTSSHLEGSFTASSDRMLFFTIPFDRGWVIRIDGKEVPAVEVFDIFMAVPAPEGTHTLDMRYLPVGLIPGLFITLISIAILILIRRKESQRCSKTTQ